MAEDFDRKGFKYIQNVELGADASPENLLRYQMNVQKMATERKLDQISMWLYADETSKGLRIGSNNFLQYASIRIALFGDGPTIRGFTYTQTMTAPESLHKEWAGSARSFLADRGIPIDYERDNNNHRFFFDRFSQQAEFVHAINTGEIKVGGPTREQDLWTQFKSKPPGPDDKLN